MEEVWKGLNLSPNQPTDTRPSVFPGFPLLGLSVQDLLSRPPPVTQRVRFPDDHGLRSTSEGSYIAASSEPWLSLSSSLNTERVKQQSENYRQGKGPCPIAISPAVSSSPTTVEFAILQKRVHEIDEVSNEKKLRLIKSRESADRCRARKQAHTQELEIKLQRLKRENANLKRELQKRRTLFPKKQRLQRTLTSPF